VQLKQAQTHWEQNQLSDNFIIETNKPE